MLTSTKKRMFFAAAFLSIVSIVSWRPGPYGEICEYNNAAYKKDCTSYEFAPFIAVKVFNTLNDYGVAITALATLIIAGFTGTLWKATSCQAQLTRDAIELNNKEFIATHRPKIIARKFQIMERHIPADKPVNITFIAQNIGESVGTIVEVRSATVIHNVREHIPTNFSFPYSEAFNFDLPSGKHDVVPANGASTLSKNESREIFAGELAFYCIGVLLYDDVVGIRRETGFCRRYFPREDRWETIESEYEYAY